MLKKIIDKYMLLPYTRWPKNVSHCQIIKKIILSHIKVCQWG